MKLSSIAKIKSGQILKRNESFKSKTPKGTAKCILQPFEDYKIRYSKKMHNYISERALLPQNHPLIILGRTSGVPVRITIKEPTIIDNNCYAVIPYKKDEEFLLFLEYCIRLFCCDKKNITVREINSFELYVPDKSFYELFLKYANHIEDMTNSIDEHKKAINTIIRESISKKIRNK